MPRFALPLALLLSIASLGAAQQPAATRAGPQIAWVTDHLTPVYLTYRITVQGNPYDSMHLRLERLSDAAGPRIRFSGAIGGTSSPAELDTMTVDAATLAPVHLWTRTGEAVSSDLTWRGTHVTGHIHDERRGNMPERNVDTTLAAGMLDDNEVMWSLSALPLAAGGRWQLPSFSWTDDKAELTNVQVVGEASITVPAGTFACWKLSISVNSTPFDVYITKAAPYVMTKYELTGMHLAFELVSQTP